MNKQELIRKYFWEQKKEEIFGLLKIIYFLSLFLGIIGVGILWSFYDTKEIGITWPLIITIYLGINALFWIIIGLWIWIDNNLEEAKENAEEEISKHRTVRGKGSLTVRRRKTTSRQIRRGK